MIPFLVTDRPVSLRIIKGFPLQNYPNIRIGLMANANTSRNFQKVLKAYPCDDFASCEAIGGEPCPHQDNIDSCSVREHILEHTVKMCDSGIFTRDGATLTYQELFETYKRMGVEYGIMIDVFRDAEATIESAKEALPIYEPYRDSFHLVGVAHGATVEEYVDCYRQLKALGVEYVAVGGLLQKIENTVRHTKVRDEAFMYDILERLQQEFPNDTWWFPLGCFSPGRLAKFEELNVWGSDYKGWIFQYKKRNQVLNPLLKNFSTNHLEHLSVDISNEYISNIQMAINQRNEVIIKRKHLTQKLNKGKRELRDYLKSLLPSIRDNLPDMAKGFEKLTTRGLLSKDEQSFIEEVLLQLNPSSYRSIANRIFKYVNNNRNITDEIKSIESRLEEANKLIQRHIDKLMVSNIDLPIDIKQTCAEIFEIINRLEQKHRFMQVQGNMALNIFDHL